jgi:hypothetical protein
LHWRSDYVEWDQRAIVVSAHLKPSWYVWMYATLLVFRQPKKHFADQRQPLYFQAAAATPIITTAVPIRM